MTWEEINEQFDNGSIWLHYVVEILALNANIEIESKKNKRNFLNDPYYNNYDRFTKVLCYDYLKTINEFTSCTVNTSYANNIPLIEHHKRIHNL